MIGNLKNPSFNLGVSLFHFAKWSNFYQSDRTLSDEIRYVLERKDLPSRLGQTLERPTLLNNRDYVGKTTFDNEVLHAGEDFSMHNEQMQY
jgi:hypothetical protein